MSSLAAVLQRCVATSDVGDRQVIDGAETLIIVDRHRLSRAAMEAFFRATHTDRMIFAIDGAEQLSELPNCSAGENAVVLLCTGSQSLADPLVQGDLAQIRTELPRSPVMVLTDLHSEEQLAAAMEAGVNAYVPTSVSPEVVTRLVDVVRYGSIFIASMPDTVSMPKPRHAGATAQRARLHEEQARRRGLPAFTPRELQVVRCLRTGMQNKMIAYQLNLQESTVKVHVRNILKKLDVRTRTQAALFARDIGIGDAVALAKEAGMNEVGQTAVLTRPSPVRANHFHGSGTSQA